jgi:molybdenum cofactor cytidylyltransferase
VSALVFDAVVLAAGESARLGRPKQLLPYAGTTLLGHAVDCVRSVGARRVLVVIGAHLELLRTEVARLHVAHLENLGWREGRGSSLRAGAAAILDGVDAPDGVLVVVSDQPRVGVAELARLVERWRAQPDHIVACAYDGGLGVPALFPRELAGELRASGGDRGAKAVIHGHLARTLRVDCPAAAQDVDTEADYVRLRSSMSS